MAQLIGVCGTIAAAFNSFAEDAVNQLNCSPDTNGTLVVTCSSALALQADVNTSSRERAWEDFKQSMPDDRRSVQFFFDSELEPVRFPVRDGFSLAVWLYHDVALGYAMILYADLMAKKEQRKFTYPIEALGQDYSL
jgi:hypothetical protein